MQLTFHIILQKPPADTVYSLQKGSGNNYEVVQVQRTDGRDLQFDVPAEVKGDRQTKAVPDFKGPFVQGPVNGRFIYLDIGMYAGGGGWSGRLKIPLVGITWDMITDGIILETTVPGTGKKGLPNCATVKPFDGWKVRSA